MTAPMTPDREQEIRTLDLLELMSDRVAPVISGHLAALLAEVDRLRAESSQLSTDLTGACLGRWEEEQETARMRLALESARRGRRELRARVSQLENSAALAEEDYGRIVRGACLVESQLRARITELEAAQRCPSQMTTSLGTSQCALPVRHRGDHRNAVSNHYWSDEYADAARVQPSVTAAPAEDPHDSPLRHNSAPDGDLPEATPDSPWERAVAGLNALVDAGVDFHVEPDGHISAPFSDEHIEWDLRSRRWVLTHDDEDGAL
ncbi:hypothetical protein [Streptomyces sp. NPDC102437]|uniref:hypothetical protein n=1 Tax=Streptomyces sp. NPDC102437 TaxID=3366175 RepID=UPI003811957E